MYNPKETEGIILSEEEFESLDLKALPLWSPYSAHDPRSVNYKRVLIRPEIRWGHVVGCIFALLFLQCLMYGVVMYLSQNIALSLLSVVVVSFLFLFLLRRIIVKGLIRLYQHFAPESIRKRCMFEPSCSDYMIAAINKYGTFHGILKGIDRLKRCNPNGGGFDNP